MLDYGITFVTQIRSWKATALQLLAPFAFIILIWGLSRLPQALEDELDPPVLHVERLPHCMVSEWMCMSNPKVELVNHALIVTLVFFPIIIMLSQVVLYHKYLYRSPSVHSLCKNLDPTFKQDRPVEHRLFLRSG